MGKKRQNPYNKRDLCAVLDKLSQFWPDDYWLFVANGTVCLMEKEPDGTISIDQDRVVDSFSGIEADGGDW